MPERDWDQRYHDNDLPWDTGRPDPHLTAFVTERALTPRRTLEVGCGTGTNALWLAEHGFDVLGVDVSPRAIELANAKLETCDPAIAERCRFATLDFLVGELPSQPFAVVYDRGCFHVFDAPDDRARFAERVATCLGPEGLWLSLIGSTEGPARDHGPPRRSIRDLAEAIEPVLEFVELRSLEFPAKLPSPAAAWLCLFRRRKVPAQPSTERPM